MLEQSLSNLTSFNIWHWEKYSFKTLSRSRTFLHWHWNRLRRATCTTVSTSSPVTPSSPLAKCWGKAIVKKRWNELHRSTNANSTFNLWMQFNLHGNGRINHYLSTWNPQVFHNFRIKKIFDLDIYDSTKSATCPGTRSTCRSTTASAPSTSCRPSCWSSRPPASSTSPSDTTTTSSKRWRKELQVNWLKIYGTLQQLICRFLGYFENFDC